MIEFGLRKIPCQQQKSFNLSYKGCKVGEFIPDLIVFDAVIVDTKTIDRITDLERGQMLNYLRITKLRVGVMLNFKNPKLEWERLVLLFVSISGKKHESFHPCRMRQRPARLTSTK